MRCKLKVGCKINWNSRTNFSFDFCNYWKMGSYWLFNCSKIDTALQRYRYNKNGICTYWNDVEFWKCYFIGNFINEFVIEDLT